MGNQFAAEDGRRYDQPSRPEEDYSRGIEAKPARTTATIAELFNELDDLISSQAELIGMLENKVTPVLSPLHDGQEVPVKGDRPSCSNVAGMLHDIHERLRRANRQLNEITSRVEL